MAYIASISSSSSSTSSSSPFSTPPLDTTRTSDSSSSTSSSSSEGQVWQHISPSYNGLRSLISPTLPLAALAGASQPANVSESASISPKKHYVKQDSDGSNYYEQHDGGKAYETAKSYENGLVEAVSYGDRYYPYEHWQSSPPEQRRAALSEIMKKGNSYLLILIFKDLASEEEITKAIDDHGLVILQNALNSEKSRIDKYFTTLFNMFNPKQIARLESNDLNRMILACLKNQDNSIVDYVLQHPNISLMQKISIPCFICREYNYIPNTINSTDIGLPDSHIKTALFNICTAAVNAATTTLNHQAVINTICHEILDFLSIYNIDDLDAAIKHRIPPDLLEIALNYLSPLNYLSSFSRDEVIDSIIHEATPQLMSWANALIPAVPPEVSLLPPGVQLLPPL